MTASYLIPFDDGYSAIDEVVQSMVTHKIQRDDVSRITKSNNLQKISTLQMNEAIPNPNGPGLIFTLDEYEHPMPVSGLWRRVTNIWMRRSYIIIFYFDAEDFLISADTKYKSPPL
jgi:hypothetical protein